MIHGQVSRHRPLVDHSRVAQEATDSGAIGSV